MTTSIILIVVMICTLTMIGFANHNDNSRVGKYSRPDMSDKLDHPLILGEEEIDCSVIIFEKEIVQGDEKSGDQPFSKIFMGDVDSENKKNTKDKQLIHELLFSSFGMQSEVADLLAEKKKGKEWGTIVKEHNESKVKFKPSVFPRGYLDKYLMDEKLNCDDVMTGDRLSQIVVNNSNVSKDDVLVEFESLMERRLNGENWADIKMALGLINNSEGIKTISIPLSKIHKMMESDEGLEEWEIIEALTISEVLDIKVTIEKHSSINDNRIDTMSEGKIKKAIEGASAYDEMYGDYLQKKYDY